MKNNFRPLILFLITTLPLVSLAQKKDWSFVDRTGIKGVQFSLGSYKLINEDTWKNMLSGYVNEVAVEDSVFVMHTPYFGGKRPLIQFEVVYAPFRFSSNSWLRNTEVFGGIGHRSFDETIKTNRGGALSENEFQYFERTYTMGFNHTSAQLRVAVNKSVFPSLMVYGSAGLGMGISGGLTINGSDILESYYSRSDTSSNFYNKSNFIHPAHEVFYQSKGIRQQSLSLGLKYYITCRLNVYAEYGVEFLQIHKPGYKSIRQNSHGFQLGLRFKFNPPEPVEEEDKVKDKNVFW